MVGDDLQGYINTLELAARELPSHAHPAHRERLLRLCDRYKLQLERMRHGQKVIGDFCERMTGK